MFAFRTMFRESNAVVRTHSVALRRGISWSGSVGRWDNRCIAVWNEALHPLAWGAFPGCKLDGAVISATG